MKEKFNLSERIDGQRRIDGELVLSIEDVKEFIKRNIGCGIDIGGWNWKNL